METNKLEKIKFAGRIFKKGFVTQIIDPNTIMLATTMGLAQGFKYKGDFNRGLTAGVVTLGVMGGVNGVKTIIENWDVVKCI